MMGIKLDKKLLDKWWVNEDGRDGSIDLDPSFPESRKPQKLFAKHLTAGPKEIKKWMIQKTAPDISDYLKVEKIDDQQGPWILADGIIGEKNVKKSRKITTFIYGILVDPADVNKLNEFLSGLPFPGNNEVPDLPETKDIFAGELGWREKNTPETILELKIKRGEISRRLTKQEKEWHSMRITYSFFGEKDNEKVVKEKNTPPEFKTEPVYEKIKVQRLARWFATKDYSYLGRDDDTTGLHILSKRLTKAHKLHCRATSFNLVNSKGKTVAIPVATGDQYGTHENLLYLRKEFLDKILKKTGKAFVLITWGERQYWPESGFEHPKELAPYYEKYQNIYKEIIKYDHLS